MNWKAKQRYGTFFMFLFICLSLMVACTQEGTKPVDKVENEEPDDTEVEQELVTIQIGYPFGEESFNKRFGPIDEALEHIELEHVGFGNSVESLQELFASNTLPDIFFGSIEHFEEVEIIEPLDELAEKHNFDISKLEPSLVEFIRAQDSERRLVGFPDGTSYAATYYNKEIFDLFGVPYLDENKQYTWDELLDIARLMTGERNGVQYVGMQIGWGSTPTWWEILHPLMQFAVNATDPETGEVLLTEKQEFHQYFNMMHELYSISGIYGEHSHDQNLFAQRQAAIGIGANAQLNLFPEEDLEYIKENIGMLTYPVWESQPNIGPFLGTTPIIIANYSEHKDEAFEVLMEYASPEQQIPMIRNLSSATILNDRSVLEQVLIDVETYEGKNREALFKLQPAIYDGHISRWDRYVDYHSALTKLATSDIDVNTVLRELKEETEIKIKEAKEQQ
ncbi:ABC transporter substrate-binding protein [Bacillus niameyensis]|uniref:ABC transporter substrate-binding protein n=1 Tax=Bacillus niameyensis TaxID=1522308 RepID=UPI00078633F3|nr:extracellular solute-binding protein [Bacillus niameyensis]